MDEPSDEELMRRFCGGDHSAFEALFSRHAGRVRAYLRGMVGDAALAEDLAQATFLSVVRSKDRYQRGSSFSTWLFAIATNAARDALRRRGTEQSARETLKAEEEHSVDGPTGDPGLRKELEVALQGLPATQREVVLLHQVQGLSYQQISSTLGITQTAARIRSHRGFARLRELLSHLDLEGVS
jgi:RNA polymerase sigma factor (sigma-70 family)